MNLFLVIEIFILFLFNILLLNLPLANTLGFEFALSNGVLISLLSGLLFLRFLKNKNNETIRELFKKSIQQNIYFLLLPLVLSFITIPFIKNCSLFQGLLFYIFLTLPSVVIGTGLACLSYLISKRFPTIIFIIIYLIILVSPILEIYFNPNIYFYNPILSYYPGTIYDESIPLDFKLVSYRLLNVIYFGAIIYAAHEFLKKNTKLKSFIRFVIVIAALTLALCFSLLKGELGYSTTLSRMKNELRGVLETKHFFIYYDKSISSREIGYLGLNHEYYYNELIHYFQVKPNQKITSFIFANPAQKKELIGSETADIAKPWLHYIYIYFGSYENTLKHEIAHCIAGEFGVTPLKVAHGINPALIEGIATAAANNINENTIHYMAGLAYNNNYRFPISNLFTGLSFYGGLSTLSYIYSGSFVKYLIDEEGIDKFKKVYQTGNFEEAYGKPIDQLAKEYYLFIRNFGKGNYNQAVYYFGRSPIFKKVCPRLIAEQTSDAWSLYNRDLYDEAAAKFSALLKYSDSYSALSGYISCLIKLKEYRKALMLLEQNTSKYVNTSYLYNIEFSTAELLGLNKQYKSADSLYVLIYHQNPSRQFYYLSEFRHEIIKDSSLYYSYCTGSSFDKYNCIMDFIKDSVSYVSVPILIELSRELKENYNIFIKRFDNSIKVKDYQGSYASYVLSKYALANGDYERAKDFGNLALIYPNNDENVKEILDRNLEKILWFGKFAKAEKMSFIWEGK